VSLHRVELRGIPVELHQRATEAGDELRREFALLAGDREPHDVPARLLALAEELSARFADMGDPAQDAVLAAAASGAATADAVYRVPAEVIDACEQLRAMLGEADEFCRQGDSLLTLAPSDELIAYRHWFLDQFVDQIAGRPPRTWAEVAASCQPPVEPRPPADEARETLPGAERDEAGEVSREVVLPLSGAIDLETAPAVRAAVAELRERDVADIVLDLADVTFIDSVGLSVLVSVHRRLRDEGGRLVVQRPAEAVRQVLTMTGLTGVLDIRP
jgi:anti-anti-sigma factor